jgi:hypothetical protein
MHVITRGAMFTQQWHHPQLKHLRIENNLAMIQPMIRCTIPSPKTFKCNIGAAF